MLNNLLSVTQLGGEGIGIQSKLSDLSDCSVYHHTVPSTHHNI